MACLQGVLKLGKLRIEKSCRGNGGLMANSLMTVAILSLLCQQQLSHFHIACNITHYPFQQLSPFYSLFLHVIIWSNPVLTAVPVLASAQIPCCWSFGHFICHHVSSLPHSFAFLHSHARCNEHFSESPYIPPFMAPLHIYISTTCIIYVPPYYTKSPTIVCL